MIDDRAARRCDLDSAQVQLISQLQYHLMRDFVSAIESFPAI